jgi:hypothetical protein
VVVREEEVMAIAMRVRTETWMGLVLVEEAQEEEEAEVEGMTRKARAVREATERLAAREPAQGLPWAK